MSRELRQTIREMVEKGKSNEAIYNHVQNEYGPNQIAIPHQGYLHRISYGMPYVAVGLMILVAYWLSWTWWIRGRNQPKGDLSDEEQDKMDRVANSIDSPLD